MPGLPRSASAIGAAQESSSTTQVFEDFLRKVWKDKIEFVRLNLPSPGQVPIGPTAVIDDDIAFTRNA